MTARLPRETRTLGWEVLAWTTEYLRQPDGPAAGSPWQFTPEQVRIILRWYEINGAGRFVNRRGVLRRMKGWGKDPFAAALAATELCGPCRFAGFDAKGVPVAAPHPSAWIQVAAVSQDQTRNTMTLFPGLLSPLAADEFSLDMGKTIIYANGGSARIEAVTSSPSALEGGRPSLVILNESQEWVLTNDGHAMADVIRRNLAKSNDGSARSMEICNAHRPEDNSVAEITYEAWRNADGKIPGLMYDALEATAVKDLADRDAVKAALEVARGDSHWVDLDRLCDEIADPATPEHVARRYYLNHVVVVDAERWLPAGAWKGREAAREATGPIVLGFDGSYRHDSTALIGCTLDGYLFVVKIWERPRNAPEDWKVPRLEVHETVGLAMERYEVVELAADPPGWHSEIELWERDYGEDVVVRFDTNQSTRMCPAIDRFRSAVIEKTVTHDGDAQLARHLANCVAKETRAGTQLAKPTANRKIDAAVAAVVAHERAMWHAANQREESVPLVAWAR